MEKCVGKVGEKCRGCGRVCWGVGKCVGVGKTIGGGRKSVGGGVGKSVGIWGKGGEVCC